MAFSLEKVSGEQARRGRFEKITGRKLKRDEATPEDPDSVAEILQDSERRNLFSDLVKNIDGSDGKELSRGVFERLGRKEALTSADQKLLEKARYELVLRMQDAERLGTILSNSDFESVLNTSDSIRQLMGVLPPGRGIEVMRETLPSLAMSDQKFLDDFFKAFDKVKAARGSRDFQMLRTRTERICAKYGFKEEDFGSLGDPSDPETRSRMLKKVKENLTWWGEVKEVIRLGGYSEKATERLIGIAEEVKKSKELRNLTKGLEKIGGMLAVTISKNTDLMRAITSEAVTGEEISVEAPKANGFTSLEDVHKQVGKFDQRDVTGKLWAAEKTRLEEEHEKPWANFANPEQEEAKTNYLNRVKQGMYTESTGWFGTLFAALITALIGRIDKKTLR